MSRQERMEKDNVWRVIASLAIPTALITLVMVIYNMADVFFIGKTGDSRMVNAIAVCMPVFTIVQAFGTLIGSGGCTAISVALGKGDREKSRQISSFCFYLCLGLGLILTLGLNIFAPQMIKMLGASASYSDFAILYLRILAFGCPVMMFSNAFVNIARADGSIKEPMIANLIGTLVNIVLDPIFILVFNLGVAGAAVATVIGNVISILILIKGLQKKSDFISFRAKDLSLKKDVVLKPLALGLPIASGTLLMSVSYMIMNNLLIGVGDNAQGAFGIVRSVMLLSTTTQLGICMGVQPAVSYCYGRKNIRRVKEFIVKTGTVCMVFGLLVALLCIGGRDLILNAFIADESIVLFGREMIVGCLITAPVYAIYQTAVTFLQATEWAMWSTINTLLRQGIVLIPAMLILNAAFGFGGLVFSFAVTDIVAALVGTVLLVRRMKKADPGRSDSFRDLAGAREERIA
ncbi:MAG: MATE family efflux transporter [Lachnospiraceae bacterium]|nr:MATE family efflux transporter [Lachnospiraceae bacterium]